MNHLILAINLVAFIAGSAAFACARVLSRQRPGGFIRRIQAVLLCLTFIVSCNGVDFYAREFAGVQDPRVAFMTMNFLSLVTLVVLWLMFRCVEDVTRRPFSRVSRAVFFVQSFFSYFACVALSLFAGENRIAPEAGYLVSALDGALCLVAASVICLVRLGEIDAAHRRFVRGLIPFGLAFAVFDAASELGVWHSLIGLPGMAMSPFILVIISALTIWRSMDSLGRYPSRGDSAPTPPPEESSSFDFRIDSRWDLSAREKDVLALLARGLENADISGRLFISPHTVKNHVSNIYRKTGAKNRIDLIRILGGSGWAADTGNQSPEKKG